MFENTLGDLEQVVAAMECASSVKELELNEYELVAFKRMRALATAYLEQHARLVSAEFDREFEELNKLLVD